MNVVFYTEVMFYTGAGDDGSSKLFGAHERASKATPIFDTLGNLDELGALLGVCYARAKAHTPPGPAVAPVLRALQEDLFIIQAELAGADKKLTMATVTRLEKIIEEYTATVVNPHSFVIAGSTELSALLDFARTVARRTERSLIALTAPVSPVQRTYLNRLSSVLYVLARAVAQASGEPEQSPHY